MLVRFSFTNFRSFREETVLEMEASAEKSLESTLLQAKGKRILPVAAVYGANASGKTNVNRAFEFAVNYVRNSSQMQVNTPTYAVPFLLDDDSRSEPVDFHFMFIYNDRQFEYGFSLNQTRIIEEYLYEYKSEIPSLIFERTNTNRYHFGQALRKELGPLTARNTDNKLFLPTAAMWNASSVRDACLWFAEKIDTYNLSNLESCFYQFLDQHDPEKIKDLLLPILSSADMSMADIDVQVYRTDLSGLHLPLVSTLENEVMNQRKEKARSYDVKICHEVIVDGEKKKYWFPIHQESSGTRKFIQYAPLLITALQQGKTIIIDDLDTSLHPGLVSYIVRLFEDPDLNKNGAQLIFNTHDTNQMDPNLLRRDEIYLTEKNRKTGISKLFPLSDFPVKNSDNTAHRYMAGRYGAVPKTDLEDLRELFG